MLSRCTRFVNPTRRSCARFVSPTRRTFVSTFRSNSSINHGRTPIDPFEWPKLILEQIPSKKVLAGVGLSAFGLFLLSESIFISDAGISYVQQNSLTGELAVYSKPGVHFRVPFFSNVTAYKQVITASFGEKEQSLFCTPDPVKVRLQIHILEECLVLFVFVYHPTMNQCAKYTKNFVLNLISQRNY